MTLMQYDDVIASLLKKNRVPNLLFGNGFSMAYDSEIFSYNALYNFVENLDNELLSKLFEIVKTKNFELVMKHLDSFCQLLTVFEPESKILNKIVEAKSNLKNSLIDAINALHPEHVFKLTKEDCDQCAQFLSPYLENDGHIFSTNYDILLYWVLMRCEVKNCIDGFGREREDDDDFDSEPQYSELRWGNNKSRQNIHYLHGALPLFDTGIDVVKEEYTGDGYLLDNIRRRIEQGDYPIFITAGNGQEKLEHIKHNEYLSFCYNALENVSGSLVTFGFNFGEYDHHIIDAINKAARKPKPNRLWSIYIGVYSEADEKHISSIKSKFKCKVHQFDAKTAKIWR